MTTSPLLPAKIKALRKALPNYPHRSYTRTDSPDAVGASWASMGKPYLWEHLETKYVRTTSYSAYRDLGYGNIALFKSGLTGTTSLVGVTDRPILAIKGHPILLDKEYYGVDKYIWR